MKLKTKDITFDCLNNVDWEALYKQKIHLLDVINFVGANADLVYEHLSEIYNDGQKEVAVNMEDVLESLEGIVNFLDSIQDTAEEEGLWEHPLEDESTTDLDE